MYNRNMWILAIAKLLSGLGAYCYDIGIVIYLFDETKSIAVISGFFVSQMLPAFIILLSGELIDKCNKKKLAVISNIVKIILFCGIMQYRNVWFIYVVTFLYNFIIEFEDNTFQALINISFDKKHILIISSKINVIDSFSMVVAPVCVSVITMYFSLSANFIIAIILFAFAAISYGCVKGEGQSVYEKAEANHIWDNYISIFQNRPLFKTIMFWCVFMLCIGLTNPLEVSMIEETLGMPSSYYGLGNTIEGTGMLVTSGFILIIIKKLQSKDLIGLGLLAEAFGCLIIGVSKSIYIYFIGAILVGTSSTLCPLGFKTDIQAKCSSSIVGRTFSATRFTVLLSRMLGLFAAGKITQLIGIRIIYFAVFIFLTIAAIVYKKC